MIIYLYISNAQAPQPPPCLQVHEENMSTSACAHMSNVLFGCAPKRYMQTSWHPKPSILDCLLTPWGPIWESFFPLEPSAPGRHMQIAIWNQFARKSQSILGTNLTPKSTKVTKKQKKQAPRKQAEQKSISDPSPTSPMQLPHSKYHMFRRVHPSPFEWLWGHFGIPFGITF